MYASQESNVLLNLSQLIRIVLAILAAYRLALMVATEDGPADIFYRLRDLMGVYRRVTYNALTDEEYSEPSTSVGKLFECPYCLGMWFALAMALLVLCPSWAGDYLLLAFGIAGGQAWLQNKSTD